MLRAVGYARISKDDTLEGRGVTRQTEDITAVCERNGWDLLDVLVDNDVSASRYSKKARPGYARLMELIDAEAVDRAVVYDVDRLLRQPRQLEDLIDLCERRNGAFGLHNVNGELDLVTSSGRFVARMLVAKAAMESDDLSRRLRRSSDQRAAEGKPHGARAFGYEPDGMTIREEEAKLLQEAATDVLNGTSLNTIARRWNALGVLTPQRSKQWNGTIVKSVLTNPRHAGLRVHRREVVGPAAWPAVLDRSTHDRLVAHLTATKPRTPPRRTAFTGLIRDAATGVPLSRDVVRGRPAYRGHKHPGREATYVTIGAEPLERAIVEMLFDAIDNGDLGRHLGAMSPIGDTPELAPIEEDLRTLAEDFGNGTITRAEWMAARGPLERRLSDARGTLERQQRGRVSTAVDVDLRERWGDLDVDRQREILAAVFEAILIHPAKRKGGPGVDLGRIEPRWRS